MDDAFELDTAALRRSFERASRTFDAAAVLHSEVRQRALERLKLLRAIPEVILDLGAGTGPAARWFAGRFPRARVIALDFSLGMLQASRRKLGAWRRLLGTGPVHVLGDITRLPLRDASVDWVFANLALPWCSLDATLEQIKRVLKPGGVFACTTFGPDTLSELRRAWRSADRFAHVHPFVDMHDLGDALVRAGFAEPVLDVERITLTYRSVENLLKELKATGSRNALPVRSRGLTTPATLARVKAAYENDRRDDALPATFEIVYGQAWQSTARRLAAGTETLIPLNSLRRRRP